MEMFEQATRQKLRFESPKGLLTAEDLWDIPLTSTNIANVNLDDIAKSLYRELRSSAETQSFVTPANNDAVTDEMQLKLNLAKHIIGVRVAERDAAAQLAERRAKRQQILEIISRKENAALEGQSLDDLRRMVGEL